MNRRPVWIWWMGKRADGRLFTMRARDFDYREDDLEILQDADVVFRMRDGDYTQTSCDFRSELVY